MSRGHKPNKMTTWIEGQAHAGRDVTYAGVQQWALKEGEDDNYRRIKDAIHAVCARLQRNDGLLFRNITKGFFQPATYRIVNDRPEDYRSAHYANVRQAAAYGKAADNVIPEINNSYFEAEVRDVLQPLVGEHLATQILKVEKMVMLLPPEQKARAYGMFIARGPQLLVEA